MQERSAAFIRSFHFRRRRRPRRRRPDARPPPPQRVEVQDFGRGRYPRQVPACGTAAAARHDARRVQRPDSSRSRRLADVAAIIGPPIPYAPRRVRPTYPPSSPPRRARGRSCRGVRPRACSPRLQPASALSASRARDTHCTSATSPGLSPPVPCVPGPGPARPGPPVHVRDAMVE